MLRIIALALALFAFALPIVGPLDDHHFAERTHTHGHIYLDGRAASHQHLLESGTVHEHSGARDDANALRNWHGAGSTVYLTDPTVSLMLATLNSPSHNAPEALRPTPPRGNETNPLASSRVQKPQLAGRHIAPPLPPPIA